MDAERARRLRHHPGELAPTDDAYDGCGVERTVDHGPAGPYQCPASGRLCGLEALGGGEPPRPADDPDPGDGEAQPCAEEIRSAHEEFAFARQALFDTL